MTKNSIHSSRGKDSNNATNPSQFLYNKVKQEAKIFSNILFILGKVEQDGFFNTILQNFDKIIESEMFYAVSELKKIQRKSPKFDIKGQLINNTYIYKENLKLLSGMLIDQLWKEKVKEENISEFVSMSSLKGYMKIGDEIKEEGEEEDNSEKESKESSIVKDDPYKEAMAEQETEKHQYFDYKMNPQNEISENNENANIDKDAEDNEQGFGQNQETHESAEKHVNESSDTWKFKEKNVNKTDENDQDSDNNVLQKSLLEKNKNDEMDEHVVSNNKSEKLKDFNQIQIEKGINNANSFQEPNESINEDDAVIKQNPQWYDISNNNNLQSDRSEDNSEANKSKILKQKNLEIEKDQIVDNNNGTKEIFENSEDRNVDLVKKEETTNSKSVTNHLPRKFFCEKFKTEVTDPDHLSISNEISEPEIQIIKQTTKNDAKDESNNISLNKSCDLVLQKKIDQKALVHPSHEQLNQIVNQPLPIQFQQLTIQSQINNNYAGTNSTSLPTSTTNRPVRQQNDFIFSSPQDQKSNERPKKVMSKNDMVNLEQFIKSERTNNLENYAHGDSDRLRINNMQNINNYEKKQAEHYKILQLHNHNDFHDNNLQTSNDGNGGSPNYNMHGQFLNNSSNHSLSSKKYGLNSHKLEELQNNLRKVYKIESLNVKNKKINLKKLLKTHELNFTSPSKIQNQGKSQNLSASDRHTKGHSSISSQFNNSLNYNGSLTNQNFISESQQNRYEQSHGLKLNKDIFNNPKGQKEKLFLDNSLNIEGNISTRVALSKKLPGTTPVKSKQISNTRDKKRG